MFRSRLLAQIALPALLSFCLAMGSAQAALPDDTGLVKAGQTLPEVTMDGLNGPPRKLSSFQGRPLIINVWASWCTPCRAEAASLERLAWSEAGKPYTVIGISTDDDRAAALKWLRQSNATLSHFIDANVHLENLLGASRIPLTVLVDANGRVVEKFRGAQEWDSKESIQQIREAFRTGPVKASAKP